VYVSVGYDGRKVVEYPPCSTHGHSPASVRGTDEAFEKQGFACSSITFLLLQCIHSWSSNVKCVASPVFPWSVVCSVDSLRDCLGGDGDGPYVCPPAPPAVTSTTVTMHACRKLLLARAQVPVHLPPPTQARVHGPVIILRLASSSARAGETAECLASASASASQIRNGYTTSTVWLVHQPCLSQLHPWPPIHPKTMSR
jgi:hypothetical protein